MARRSRRRPPPPPPRGRRRPAEDALVVLRALAEGQVGLEHARFTLAVALLMTCASVEHAQRILVVVEEVHVARGVDLHLAVRARPA